MSIQSKKFFLCIIFGAVHAFAQQHPIEQKYNVSAVTELTREYNFLRSIEDVYEFDVESFRQFDGKFSYLVKGRSNLCVWNTPYLDQTEFNQFFVVSKTDSKKVNLKSGLILDVTRADSFARNLGAECLSGNSKDNDLQLVCDKLGKPKDTIVYLTINFKMHPENNSKLGEGFFSCYKQAPFGQTIDISLSELEADFPKMGLKLLN